MFRRQRRLSRVDFDFILHQITPDIARNENMAIRSPGSSVHPILKLAITLRILAGASYVDLYWYAVELNSIAAIVIETCE
jgi:hypothetical protein